MNNPTPTEIRRTRESAGLTQTQAAAMIHYGLRAWQNMRPRFRELADGLRERDALRQRFPDQGLPRESFVELQGGS